MKTGDIDIVIPWVDGSDPKWQENYRKNVVFLNNNDSNTIIRYRDWDNLQYLFRGIEEFMPWVRKVHFVTCGQKPEWLNIHAPKLNFVTHDDFIDKEYLPTFSVRPIEINIHKIPDLAEQFIYFNDDFFVLSPMKEEDFFRDGKPVDMAALDVLQTNSPRVHVMANNVIMINRFFSLKEVFKKNRRLWLNLSYGHFLTKTICLMRSKIFPGFQDSHLPQPYLKSTYREVWEHCEDKLQETSSHRFRDISDINQSLFRYWQIVSGNICPENIFKRRCYFLISNGNLKTVCEAIKSRKRSLLVLNDSDEIENFEEVKEQIKASFDQILPNKSSFEL